MTGRRSLAQIIGLSLLLGLTVFFRFWHLEQKLLWHDELATRVFAAGYTVDEWKRALYTGEIFDVADVERFQHLNPARSVGAAIRGLAEDDPQHPPLYYVLARLWVLTFGDRIATLRALSALFSLLSIPLMYWLARELFDSEPIAMFSAALFGVSPFFVLYAQEAREYALWTGLIVLSNASLLRAIRLTGAETRVSGKLAGAWGLYSLATVLSLYTSFTSASMIIAQLLYLCFRERLRPTRVAAMSFVALAVSALAFLPWAVELLRHYDAFQVSMRWSREIHIPRTALIRILGQNISRTVVDLGHDVEGPVDYAAMLPAVALVVAAFGWLAARAPRNSSALLLLLFVVPIGMLIGPDLLSGGIRSVSTRYMTPAWVTAIPALGFLLATPHPEKRWWPAFPALVIGTAIASSAGNVTRFTSWTKATSVSLPKVAEAINAEPHALLVGNLERHNPGNLMALAVLLRPGTKMQFLDVKMEEHWVLPRDVGTVFLFSPIPEYRAAMEEREHVKTRLVLQDTFLDLWKIEGY
ncbi:MAG TPA: glycosyltransferase family 39 protein [bacterium]|nr:glycosyltransferase family 39 protein [bacterium]